MLRIWLWPAGATVMHAGRGVRYGVWLLMIYRLYKAPVVRAELVSLDVLRKAHTGFFLGAAGDPRAVVAATPLARGTLVPIFPELPPLENPRYWVRLNYV